MITSIDGKPATDASLRAAKKRADLGGTLRLGLVREGEHRDLACGVGAERR
ncbi:MAG: hypothetical protein GY711_02150 [bacterium]|nr:hypothetical protein [bacterium]